MIIPNQPENNCKSPVDFEERNIPKQNMSSKSPVDVSKDFAQMALGFIVRELLAAGLFWTYPQLCTAEGFSLHDATKCCVHSDSCQLQGQHHSIILYLASRAFTCWLLHSEPSQVPAWWFKWKPQNYAGNCKQFTISSTWCMLTNASDEFPNSTCSHLGRGRYVAFYRSHHSQVRTIPALPPCSMAACAIRDVLWWKIPKINPPHPLNPSECPCMLYIIVQKSADGHKPFMTFDWKIVQEPHNHGNFEAYWFILYHISLIRRLFLGMISIPIPRVPAVHFTAPSSLETPGDLVGHVGPMLDGENPPKKGGFQSIEMCGCLTQCLTQWKSMVDEMAILSWKN